MPDVKSKLRGSDMAYTFADDLPKSPVSQTGRATDRQGMLSVIVPSAPRAGMYRRAGKRALDIFAVLLLTPIAIPVLLIVGFITAFDGGPVIFSQPRIGRDGRVFKCWKIRTMVPNAETVLAKMIRDNDDVAHEWRTRQKLARDPRITRWGRMLRRSSVDELPQFWNVLTGDMSLVGPRPFTPEQKALYDASGQSEAYYRLRPGITGLWQVDQRNEGAFGDRVTYDRNYDRDLSIWTDTKIFLRTILVVLRATGK